MKCKLVAVIAAAAAVAVAVLYFVYTYASYVSRFFRTMYFVSICCTCIGLGNIRYRRRCRHIPMCLVCLHHIRIFLCVACLFFFAIEFLKLHILLGVHMLNWLPLDAVACSILQVTSKQPKSHTNTQQNHFVLCI